MTILSSSMSWSSLLCVPPAIYAVSGVPLSVYIESAKISPLKAGETLDVETPIGETREGGVWSLTATENQVGDHPWILRLKNASGEVMDEATSVLRVLPADAGEKQELTLLLVGDSLTHMSLYPNKIAELLNFPGNPHWQMLGSHTPSGAAEGVAHEGYGGWTWERFVTQYFPDKPAGEKLGSSPFLFLGRDGGEAVLDVERYIQKRCGGRQPHLVIFLLGINDCFQADPEDSTAIDSRIDAMILQAEILLSAFRQALPNAELGIGLVPAPNARESAFEKVYKGAYTQAGWRKIQSRLVERQCENFANREGEHISLVPLSLAVDPIHGYAPDNDVHPNLEGCNDIGVNVFAWIKNQLAVKDTRNGKKTLVYDHFGG